VSRAGEDASVAEPAPLVGEFGGDEEGVDVFVGVGDVPVVRVLLTMSFATDRPAASAPFSTFAARFIRFIASAIVVADTFPARSRSSTASVNRVKGLEPGVWRSA